MNKQIEKAKKWIEENKYTLEIGVCDGITCFIAAVIGGYFVVNNIALRVDAEKVADLILKEMNKG